MDPRDLPRTVRRHIAQGYLDPKHPFSIDGLTAKGEAEAERRHFGGDDPGDDPGDYGWDPGDGPS